MGTISLDLFAVLLGGATALLPIFARDILHAGPWGLGLLRAAPAIGALVMSIWLARRPLQSDVGKKMLLAYLANLFTRKFAEALSDKLPVDKNLASLSKAEIEDIAGLIHEFKVKPAGDKGYDKAEVMRGGVSTDELSSKTLEVKKIPGLYYGGECVDVTGWLGGYNFQWAWASGFVIAQGI